MTVSRRVAHYAYETDNFQIDPTVGPLEAGTALSWRTGTVTVFPSTGADTERFAGIILDSYGGTGQPTGAANPVQPDAMPQLALWGFGITVLIEDSATVAVGDDLTFSSITAGTLRPAAAGEPVVGRAWEAIASGGVGLKIAASIIPAAHLGGSALAGAGAAGGTLVVPSISVGVETADVIPVTITALDGLGNPIAAVVSYELELVRRITGIRELAAVHTITATTGSVNPNTQPYTRGTSDASGLLVLNVNDVVGASGNQLQLNVLPAKTSTSIVAFGPKLISDPIAFN